MPLKPQVPLIDYPTVRIEDTLLVETKSSTFGNWSPVRAGTSFQGRSQSELDTFGSHLFLKQKAAEGDDEFLINYWGTEPVNQDTYNWVLKYLANSNSHPTFIRTYLERRDEYAPRTKGTAFTGVYRISMSTAGTGYTSAPTVTISGGSGSGATAVAILNNDGGVERIELTAEGSGYTTAPTVSFSGGGGSSAAATARIQGATCVLIEEEVLEAKEPWDGLYVRVVRVYATYPGPEVITYKQMPGGVYMKIISQDVLATQKPSATGGNLISDIVKAVDSVVAKRETVYAVNISDAATMIEVTTETKVDKPPCTIYTTRRYPRASSVTLPSIGDVINTTGFVIAARKIPMDDSPNFVHEIDWMYAVPTTYTEYPCDGYAFPGVLNADNNASYLNDTEANYRIRFFRLGVQYTYQRPRHGKYPMKATYSFSRASEAVIPGPTFTVITPGVNSRLIEVPDNTVHNAWTYTETGANGYPSRTAEVIAASTPGTYATTTLYTIHDEVKLWKGDVYVRTKIEIREDGNYAPAP